MIERMPPSNYPARSQKLRPDQIASRKTWARIPETDLIGATAHRIHVMPRGASTITMMNEMDPGISEETVGEGRGWFDPPRSYGPVMAHGNCLR